MGKWNVDTPPCIYNPGVMCGIGIFGDDPEWVPENCEDCGWNPEEQKRREEKLKAAREAATS